MVYMPLKKWYRYNENISGDPYNICFQGAYKIWLQLFYQKKVNVSVIFENVVFTEAYNIL